MSVQAALKPGEQARDWKRRWREIQAELQRLLTERTGALSGPRFWTLNASCWPSTFTPTT
jgi:hypothetical protein